MTRGQGKTAADAEENARLRREKSLRIATEARETAALIVGPHEPVAEHLSCEQHDQRIEALALVIYQARGYSQATELPA